MLLQNVNVNVKLVLLQNINNLPKYHYGKLDTKPCFLGLKLLLSKSKLRAREQAVNILRSDFFVIFVHGQFLTQLISCGWSEN